MACDRVRDLRWAAAVSTQHIDRVLVGEADVGVCSWVWEQGAGCCLMDVLHLGSVLVETGMGLRVGWGLTAFEFIFQIGVREWAVSTVSEVFIENYKVVVLGYKCLKTEMLCHEANQLRWGAIICELMGLNTFLSEHGFEQLFAIAASLNSFVNIKIQDTKRLHFNQGVHSCPNE